LRQCEQALLYRAATTNSRHEVLLNRVECG